MTTSLLSNSSTVNQTATNRLFVPCVPISVSVNLVAASALADRLSAAVLKTSLTLVKTSFIDFTEIQRKKTELRSQIEECGIANEALLDVCKLNIEDLFSHVAAYIMAQSHVAEGIENSNAQVNAEISLQLVRDYAASVGLVVEDYCKDGIVQPEMLFTACLKRVETLQKRWQNNYFQSIELGLQLQREGVFSAVAACLSAICQDGLENQISLDPMPKAQEDVLGALATCADFPFSGQWPQLREREIVLNRQDNAVNADAKGGMQ